MGRPSKDEYKKLLKITLTDELSDILNISASETGKSKSDIIRELIPIVSSKNFEMMITKTNLELLQSYSDDCWNVLHTPNSIFETSDLSDKMPAFIINGSYPQVYVKYPTYKIQIWNHKNTLNNCSQKELEELLQPIKNRSYVYCIRADCYLIGENSDRNYFPFIDEVTCLELSLQQNELCKNSIITLLQNKGYYYSVQPSYCIRSAEIQLLEDGKYFRVIDT